MVGGGPGPAVLGPVMCLLPGADGTLRMLGLVALASVVGVPVDAGERRRSGWSATRLRLQPSLRCARPHPIPDDPAAGAGAQPRSAPGDRLRRPGDRARGHAGAGQVVAVPACGYAAADRDRRRRARGAERPRAGAGRWPGARSRSPRWRSCSPPVPPPATRGSATTFEGATRSPRASPTWRRRGPASATCTSPGGHRGHVRRVLLLSAVRRR